jgi:hypothetical protein
MLTRRGFLQLVTAGVIVTSGGRMAAAESDGPKTAKVTLAIHGMT